MKMSLILASALVLSAAHAQTSGSPSSPPAGVPLRPVIQQDPMQATPPQFEIALGWSEKTKNQQSVPLINPSDTSLKILGVQATSGVFVVDYPDTVKAKGEGLINFIYDIPENNESATEVIRVKTNQGIKTLHLRIKRDAMVTFSTREVNWKIGAQADPKTITLQIPAGSVTPLRAKVLGGGGRASLEQVDGKFYRVNIVPASTEKPRHFAVVVEFDQPLPGVAPVIVGTIGD